MSQRRNPYVIVGGLMAVSALSVSGSMAWPRADAAPRVEMKSVVIAAEPAALHAVPLRDLAAIRTTQVPLARLERNPFSLHDAPAAKSADPASRSQLLAAVQTLRLQSVLCTDAARSCTINGTSQVEGNVCRGFVLEKINAASVTLRSGVYRFELRVQS